MAPSWVRLRTMRQILLNFSLMALLATGAVAGEANEPSYQGRQLSSWLKDLQNTPAGPEYSPAAHAFREMGRDTLPFLLARASTRKPESHLALNAIRELGQLAAPAIPDLKILLRDADTSFFAANALVILGSEAPVIEALSNEHPRIRDNAVLALGYGGRRVSSSAVLPLVNLLASIDPKQRHFVVWALGQIHKLESVSVPTLIRLLDDRDAWVRKTSADALANFDPSSTTNPLTRALSDRDANVRSSAARALGSPGALKYKKVVAALTKALDDKDEGVRANAKLALGTAGTH